jgi:pimeloyl-ACP methyl ester carboxylesterase
MRGRTVRQTAVVLAAAFLWSCASGDPRPGERTVSVGSHVLEARLVGKGTPAVVFDAGIADGLDTFRHLQDRIGAVTRVVAYNRAGYGRSEPGPLPRDGEREADELMALLERESVPGPYVLVGHSLGALNAMVFASRYHEDVAGMVLLDPPPLTFALGRVFPDLRAMAERMTAEWQAIADSTAASADPREKTRSAFFSMIASEHREMGRTARLVEEIATFGDIPLAVVASGRPNPAFGPAAEEFQRYWAEQSRALAGKSTKGEFVFAEESTHFLHLDVPELVEECIVSVVNQARGM